MSALRANIRVINDCSNNSKPSSERMHEAATRLTELGFQVLRIGRFTVSVSAPNSIYKDILGYENAVEKIFVEVEPKDDQLKKLVNAVEIIELPISLI